MDNDEKSQLQSEPENSTTKSEADEDKQSTPFVWTTRKKLVGASLCICLFTALASLSIISPFFPNEALKKGASHTVVGLIFSVYPLVGIIMAPIYGKLMPTYGAKFILLTGLFIEGGTQLLFGFVSLMPDGPVFIVFCFLLRIVDALGSSGCETAAFVIVVEEFPDNMAFFTGLLDTFAGVGLMAGPPLGGVLYTAGGFKLPFIVMGVIVLLTVLLLVFALPTKDQGEVQEEQSFLQTLKIPAIMIMAVSSVTGGILLSFLDPVLSPHLSHFGAHGLNATKIGLIFLIPSGLYAVLSPGIGWIGDKTRTYSVMIALGFVFSAVSFLLIGPIPILDFLLPQRAVWLACVAMVILGISDALLLVPLMPEMLQLAKLNGMPDDISTTGIMSGIYGSAMNVGAFVGPMISGAMTEHLGFGWAAGILAFILLLQGLVLVVFGIYNKARRRTGLQTVSTDEREPLLTEPKEHDIHVQA